MSTLSHLTAESPGGVGGPHELSDLGLRLRDCLEELGERIAVVEAHDAFFEDAENACLGTRVAWMVCYWDWRLLGQCPAESLERLDSQLERCAHAMERLKARMNGSERLRC